MTDATQRDATRAYEMIKPLVVQGCGVKFERTDPGEVVVFVGFPNGNGKFSFFAGSGKPVDREARMYAVESALERAGATKRSK